MSRRILIFGGSGMLGRELGAAARAQGEQVAAPGRDKCDLARYPEHAAGLIAATKPDAVINAAGVIPIRCSDPTFADMIRVNAIAPRIMADACRQHRIPMVHVSTDCVFAGTERALARPSRMIPNADDVYGRSKILGEVVAPGVLTVRTSFVGRMHGLMAWLETLPAGEVITGYDAVWWSGSTVTVVANAILDLLFEGAAMQGGLIHLATLAPITKYQAVRTILAHFGRTDVRVHPGGPAIDRTMKPDVVLEPLAEALRREGP